MIFEDCLRVPAEAHDLGGFRRWAVSPEFPESGRIDFLAGDVEVDRSPEDLHMHGRVKVAISRFWTRSWETGTWAKCWWTAPA